MNMNTLSVLLISRSGIAAKGITFIVDNGKNISFNTNISAYVFLENAMHPLYRLAEGTIAVTFPVRRHGVYSFEYSPI